MKRSFTEADLTEQEKTMLRYVTKLTREPSCMTADDVIQLRDVGFDDVQILEIVQLASWFNYMTRIADALGVAVEPWRKGWTQELWAEKANEVLLEKDTDSEQKGD